MLERLFHVDQFNFQTAVRVRRLAQETGYFAALAWRTLLQNYLPTNLSHLDVFLPHFRQQARQPGLREEGDRFLHVWGGMETRHYSPLIVPACFQARYCRSRKKQML